MRGNHARVVARPVNASTIGTSPPLTEGGALWGYFLYAILPKRTLRVLVFEKAAKPLATSLFVYGSLHNDLHCLHPTALELQVLTGVGLTTSIYDQQHICRLVLH